MFDQTEVSVFDAEPIELYHFGGTRTDYYLTTSADPITSVGQVFTPLAGLTRSMLKVGTQEEENLSLDISLPFDHPITIEYAYQTAPPDLRLNLYRAHRHAPDDRILVWKGHVLSFSVEGRICKFRVPSLFSSLLNGVAPAPRYQAPCNHQLYDARCGVDVAAYQTVTSVTAVSSARVTVQSLGALSLPALRGGEMFDAAGEHRLIIGGTARDLEVAYPFAALSPGTQVTLRRGCNHTITECREIFNNARNFGGHPYVPQRNPFTSKP